MSEKLETRNSNARFVAFVAASALVGSGVGVAVNAGFSAYRINHENAADACPTEPDDPTATTAVEAYIDKAFSKPSSRIKKPSPADFGLHTLSSTHDPLKSYIAFKKHAIIIGGDALPTPEVVASYKSVVEHVRPVLSSYGVSLDAPNTTRGAEGLNSSDEKRTIVALADFLLTYPVETIQHTGLKHVAIQTVIDNNRNIIGEVFAAHPDTITISPSNLVKNSNIHQIEEDSQGVFKHELGHIIDYSICKPASMHDLSRDPSYTVLNNGMKYGHNTDTKEIFDQSAKLFETVRLQSSKLGSKVCELISAQTKNVTYANKYASIFNAGEDKGVTGALLFELGYYPYILSMKHSPLRAKFVKLLARFYQSDAASAEYMINEAAFKSAQDTPYLSNCVAK